MFCEDHIIFCCGLPNTLNMATVDSSSEELLVKLTSGTNISTEGVIICDPCKREDCNLEARGFCVNCLEYLCNECVRVHLKPAPCRDHVIVDKEHVPKTCRTLTLLPKTYETPCNVHPENAVTKYCPDHSVFACDVCIYLEHKGCKTSLKAVDALKDMMTSKHCKDFATFLEEILQQTSSLRECVRQNISATEEVYTKTTESARNVREAYKEAIEKMEQAIKAEAETAKGEDQIRLHRIIDECEEITKEIDQLKINCKTLVCEQKYFEFFELIKNKMIRAKTLQDRLRILEYSNKIRTYQFLPSCNMVETIERLQNVKLFRSIEDKITVYEKDISLQTTKDSTTCTISSVAICHGYLVLADKSNRSLKIVDLESKEEFKELELKSEPWDLAEIPYGEIAVTFPKEKLIQTIEIKFKFHPKDIPVKGHCYGIGYSNSILYVTFTDPPRVELRELFGKVLHRIELDQKNISIFKTPTYVAVSQVSDEATHLCVSDAGQKAIVLLEMKKLTKSDITVFTDKQLQHPSAVCSGKGGVFFVCGAESNTVRIVTRSGGIGSSILDQKDGIASPSAICVDEERRKIYVGQRESDHLRVYSLQ